MVRRSTHFSVLFLTFLRLLVPLSAALPQTKEPYVVYMGSPSGGGAGDPETVRAAHLQMLSAIVPSDERERVSLRQSYHHAFEGFASMLTEDEAAALSGHERVVSVFRDRALQLHTTRSWDFLQQTSAQLNQLSSRVTGADVIIGVVDTGVWPESASFNDAGMGEVPARWRGVCMEGPDFNKSNCNRKLIGARYYDSETDAAASASGSPRDTLGHGTHTASTAAGAAVAGADYYGLARGTARGGAPASRVAVYKACSRGGCRGSSVLKAIDDAVRDGVDVISVSIGMGGAARLPVGLPQRPHRPRPGNYTVGNIAPWILTVAASSIDRAFQSSIVLGDGSVVRGVGINLSNQSLSGGEYPLVFGSQVAGKNTTVSEASNCSPGSLNPRKVAGKVVVCVGTDPEVSRRVKKTVAEQAGARGVVLIDDAQKDTPLGSGDFPFSQVGTNAGGHILGYINCTRNPTAVILPTEDVIGFKPAPVVASFSSRGPGGLTESILKPDLMAPGVAILAAVVPSAHNGDVPAGKKPSDFAIRSGTSMACPHVAGAAAMLKSAHPRWTPSMIKSALMTTATTMDNLGRPLASSDGAAATGHDMGAGELSPPRALSPGLVFDTTTRDYLDFLCYHGYKAKAVRKVSGDARFACPAGAPSEDLAAARLNYPSISVPRLRAGNVVTVVRTVTNVGPPNATYAVAVEAPASLTVRVAPERMAFSRRWATERFEVSFHVSAGAKKGYVHGAVTWSDGAHSVRSPFAVNVM
ncbi:hypothetical protein ACP70R_004122 [Stipagrostis hirtigluma subsp. patula]